MKEYWKDWHFSARWKDIPDSARWNGEWKKFCRLSPNHALRYLWMVHHRSEDGDLGNIIVPDKLCYLHLLSSNAKNTGVLPAGLRRLEMVRCLKLESADGLAASCRELRFMYLLTDHCAMSVKFSSC